MMQSPRRLVAAVRITSALLVLPAVLASRSILVDPTDPLAKKDIFLSLSEAELHRSWSHNVDTDVLTGGASMAQAVAPALRSLTERLASLDELRDVTLIDIRLVGFNGDGAAGVQLDVQQLQQLLDSITHSTKQHVLHPSQGSSHHLPITRRFLYSVSRAGRGLATRIATTIRQHAVSGGGSVPVSAIDRLVAEDYQQQSSHVTIYLMSPLPPYRAASSAEKGNTGTVGVDNGTRTDAQPPLSYWYLDYGDDSLNVREADSAHPVQPPCPTVKWVGRSDRYAWVDLSAGPIEYGAATSGEVLCAASMPQVSRDAASLSGDASALARKLSVDLAALAVRSSRLLFAPPIAWQPTRFYERISVVVLVITDASHTSPSDHAPPVAVQRLADVLEPLASAGQQVVVETVDTSFEQCLVCAAAYSAALKAHTSAVNDPAVPGSMRMQLHPYLDAQDLRHWLQNFWEQLPAMRERRAAAHERIVPAIVFSLSSPSLALLDRSEQAVAFEDMVIAVQSRAGVAQLDEQCAGEQRVLNSADATRPLLAALLQVAFGLAPSHITWSEAHDGPEQDLLWGVGLTPFGPYSSRAGLALAQHDAVRRASLHTRFAEIISEIRQLREHFSEFGLTIDEVLNPVQHLTFLRRLNFLSSKLQQSRSFLALHNFDSAQYLLHSSWHDLKAMHSILNSSTHELRSRLTCS